MLSTLALLCALVVSPAFAADADEDLVTIEATFQLAVPSVPDGADQIRRRVTEAGGWVVEEKFTTWEGDLGEGFVVVRVPPDQVADLVSTLEGMGHIEQRKLQSPRLQGLVLDHETARENLEITRSRLQALLETEGMPLEEILEIERELERIREEADALIADQRDLADRAEMARVHVELRRNDEAMLSPRAKFHPGPRVNALVTMNGAQLDQAYVGAGLTMLFHRAFTVDLDLYPGAVDEGPAVTATLGTAVYSDFLGRGRRQWLNPYLGLRTGWAYLAPDHHFIVGPDVGIELYKSEKLMIETDVRAYALFGHDPIKLAGQGTVSVVLPF